MKRKNQYLIMVSWLLLIAAACIASLTKAEYINEYEGWIIKLKAEHKEYKKEDWSKAATDFKRYSEAEYNRFKDQFTEQEREQVDNLTGFYYAIMAKHKANQLKDEVKSIVNKAKAMVEELKKE